MVAADMLPRQVVIAPVVIVAAAARTPAHLISLASPILMPAQQTLLLVLLARRHLGQILALPVDHVLPACIHTTRHIVLPRSALTLN